MKKTLVVIFIIGIIILIFSKYMYLNNKKSNNTHSSKIVQSEYSKEFISQKGDTIFFEDFNLIDLGKTQPTEEQIKKQKKSIEEGLDGGSSMLSDTWHVKILSKNGNDLENVDLSMLPYGYASFTVNKKRFTLTSDSIMYIGDIKDIRK
ncbi:MAG: hypothetical protein KBC41_01555 [Candidatus Pacebacteria bacterium]|nr:hypothetical protein [Candidatus Paceibacterota bacterium]